MKLMELKKKDPQDYKIFVDMDGVLADFIVGIKKIIPDYDDAQYDKDAKYRNMMWKAVKKDGDGGGKLWLNLPMMSDTKKLWAYVKPYTPEILTATGDPRFGAGEQKREWVVKHLGKDIVVHVVRKSEDKKQFAKENHILIDDREKSINPWIANGGIGILHTSAANTIKELKKLGL